MPRANDVKLKTELKTKKDTRDQSLHQAVVVCGSHCYNLEGTLTIQTLLGFSQDYK